MLLCGNSIHYLSSMLSKLLEMNKIIKQYNFRSVFNQQLFVNCDIIMGAFTNSCITERSTVTMTARSNSSTG